MLKCSNPRIPNARMPNNKRKVPDYSQTHLCSCANSCTVDSQLALLCLYVPLLTLQNAILVCSVVLFDPAQKAKVDVHQSRSGQGHCKRSPSTCGSTSDGSSSGTLLGIGIGIGIGIDTGIGIGICIGVGICICIGVCFSKSPYIFVVVVGLVSHRKPMRSSTR